MKKAVFLDRDGTIIIDKIYLNDPEQIEYLPGVMPGLRRLAEAGYLLIIVTNQSGVARGLVSLENLAEIHRRIQTVCTDAGAPIASFHYAPFPADQPHPLRKPNPGMLLDGAKQHHVDLAQSWMVGDRLTDIIAGQRAGCRTVFLHGTEALDDNNDNIESRPTAVANSFTEVVSAILSPESVLNRP